MSTELNDLLNEARELENVDSSEYTAATAAHPNRDKAKTLTVRLTDDEMARLRATADERGLPVSAVVRAPSPTNCNTTRREHPCTDHRATGPQPHHRRMAKEPNSRKRERST